MSAILRCEYKPGSALFRVLNRAARSFVRTASNTFLVKVSYWLNP